MIKCNGTEDVGCYWTIGEEFIARTPKEELLQILTDHYNSHFRVTKEIVLKNYERVIGDKTEPVKL